MVKPLPKINLYSEVKMGKKSIAIVWNIESIILKQCNKNKEFDLGTTIVKEKSEIIFV